MTEPSCGCPGPTSGPEVLRAALRSVRVPTAVELDVLLPSAPSPSSSPSTDEDGVTHGTHETDEEGPVERGDLPPGDGAPDNSVGLGG